MVYSVLFTVQQTLRLGERSSGHEQDDMRMFSYANGCRLRLRTHIHLFNSVAWLCMPTKQEKERAWEVLRNSEFSIALPSSNKELLFSN